MERDLELTSLKSVVLGERGVDQRSGQSGSKTGDRERNGCIASGDQLRVESLPYASTISGRKECRRPLAERIETPANLVADKVERPHLGADGHGHPGQPAIVGGVERIHDWERQAARVGRKPSRAGINEDRRPSQVPRLW